MATTMVFKDWLKTIDLKNHNLLFELYNTVSSKNSCGNFDITSNNNDAGPWFVNEIGSDYYLNIPTECARQTFIEMLNSITPESIGVEAYYAFKKAIEEDE